MCCLLHKSFGLKSRRRREEGIGRTGNLQGLVKYYCLLGLLIECNKKWKLCDFFMPNYARTKDYYAEDYTNYAIFSGAVLCI